MKAVWATLVRELRAYFLSPLAYVVLFAFLILNGGVFAFIVSALNDPRTADAGPPLELFFNFLWWLILLVVAPVLTMRLLAEERKTGSIEVLMTAPVSENQVVLGKYLGALAFYVFLWLPTGLYGLILSSYAKVDWGPVAAGYLGFFGIGALYLAVGVFTSSLTKNQLVAAILSVVLLAFLSIGVLLAANLLETPGVKQVLDYMDVMTHQQDFARGIVDTRRLVYYLSGTGFFLFLTARVLENNKWR